MTRFSWKDLVAILALTALAAVLRGPGLADQGLTHFDEGAYAMSAQSVASGAAPEDLYPYQHFLAPPVLFLGASATMRLFEMPADEAVIMVSFVFGLATIALVYLMGLSAFGRVAAITAGLLLATSGFHAALGRTGLTDGPFAFFFLLGIHLFGAAHSRRSTGLALLAGLAIGLAWNTKYHGWLAGIIVALAVAPDLRDREQRGAIVKRLAVAAGVAIALYVPWFVYILNQPGGYGRLTEEHSSFLIPAESLRHILIQGDSQIFLDSWAGRLATGVAMLLALIVGKRVTARGALWVAAATLMGLAVGQVAVAAIAALAGLFVVARRAEVRVRIVIVYVIAFAVLTPMYTPYARLMLPLVIGIFLLAGVAVQWWVARQAERGHPWIGAVALVAAIAGFAALPREDAAMGDVTGAASGFRPAASAIAAATAGDVDFVVIGEPACIAYLRAAGRRATHSDDSSDIVAGRQPGEVFIVVEGHYARRTGNFARWRTAHPGAWKRLGAYPVHVGPIRLLDDMRPYEARRHDPTAGRYELVVYEVTVN